MKVNEKSFMGIVLSHKHSDRNIDVTEGDQSGLLITSSGVLWSILLEPLLEGNLSKVNIRLDTNGLNIGSVLAGRTIEPLSSCLTELVLNRLIVRGPARTIEIVDVQ